MPYAAVQAWLSSVMTVACLYGGGIAVWALWTHRDVPYVAVLALTLFTVVFGIAAAVVYIPVFGLLEVVWPRSLQWSGALLIGGALSLIPRALIGWRIQEFGSAFAWVEFWVRHPQQLVLSILPLAIGGAVFGLVWSRRVRAFAKTRVLGMQ